MTEPFPFARRTNWPLTANALTTVLEGFRDQNIPVLDLTESNPTRCGFSYPDESLIRSLADGENATYQPAPHGHRRAREAVCADYKDKGFDISPERIFLTASTSEAYSYLFRLLANPSDQVLFPQPSYPLFAFLGDLNDCLMDTYPLHYDGRWRIDLPKVSAIVRHDTKAIVLVNPNNPTGSFVRREELEELNFLCRQNNTALICDEVFADFAFDRKEHYPSLVDNKEVLTFVLGGISKTLGLPQMKLSWIVMNGPEELVKRANSRLEIIADTYLSVNTPVQNALPVWLSLRKRIQAEIHQRLRGNYNFLIHAAQNAEGCELLMTEGGWYAIVKIPNKYSEEEWTLSFLEKEHVLVHPGYFFDFDTEAFIVISLLPPENIFQDGIKRIFCHITGGEL
jgi:alanine-synthesizing transaminase